MDSSSPFDTAFGQTPDGSVQPEGVSVRGASQEATQAGMPLEQPNMQPMPQTPVGGPMPGMQAPVVGPSVTAQQYALSPEEEEDIFGRERLTSTGKILIVAVVIIVVSGIIAGGLYVYSVYFGQSAAKEPTTSVNGGAVNAASAADKDGDGLLDKDEARYGADPAKKDSDGDGFSDGDEVKNGYNPAGPGKLTK